MREPDEDYDYRYHDGEQEYYGREYWYRGFPYWRVVAVSAVTIILALAGFALSY